MYATHAILDVKLLSAKPAAPVIQSSNIRRYKAGKKLSVPAINLAQVARYKNIDDCPAHNPVSGSRSNPEGSWHCMRDATSPASAFHRNESQNFHKKLKGISMKTLLLTCISATLALAAGCASDPAAEAEQRQVLSEHFVPVQAHQTSDMGLSCDELTANIGDMVHAISILDKQIAYQQQSSSQFSFISALAGVSGAYAPNLRSAQLATAEGSLANAGAQIEANQSVSTKDLRGMYQYRHDTLMQLFYGKNCGAK
jgi:hypothetical protein